MKAPVTASKLRSALGEINIVLDALRAPDRTTLWEGHTSREEAINRLQRAATMLRAEAEQVEASKSPTLCIGRETFAVLNLDHLY